MIAIRRFSKMKNGITDEIVDVYEKVSSGAGYARRVSHKGETDKRWQALQMAYPAVITVPPLPRIAS